jgi:hypothetical protein
MQEAGLGGSKTVPGLLDVREHGPCLVDPTEVLALHVPQQYFEVGDLPLQLQTQLPSATTTVASLPSHVLTR